MSADLSRLNARSSGWYSKNVNKPQGLVKVGEFLGEITRVLDPQTSTVLWLLACKVSVNEIRCEVNDYVILARYICLA
jgi:hypothetical protein